MYSKNGIGAVVATALLLVVTVLAAVGFQTWFSTYSSNVFTTIEQDGSLKSLNTGIENVIGNKLYFNNAENSNLSIDKVEIDGVDCGINSTLSNGVTSINISSCAENISSSVADVVVYTDKKIFSKSQTFDDSSFNTQTNLGSGDTFITQWNTTAKGNTSNTSIRLPLEDTGNYNFTVFWGDGTNDTITSWDQAEKTHTYSSKGIYQVNITGTLDGFEFSEGYIGFPYYIYQDDAPKLIDIQQWGNVTLSNSGKQFYYAENLQITANDAPNLSGITNMSGMFENAVSFNSDISNWDVSSVTDMRRMFYAANSFNQPLDSWDTSNVQNMSRMFSGADSFNQPLDSWDTSNVQDMSRMFSGATSFNQSLNSWNTSSVQDMSYMFFDGNSFNQPLDNWNVSNVQDMSYMFSCYTNIINCSYNYSLNSWDVSNVQDMNNMFSFQEYFNQPLNNWTTSNVTTMKDMFLEATSFNQPLDNWNTSNVTAMNSMFKDAVSFNESINTWDTSSVTNMYFMFSGATSFNQPVDGWDTSSVTDMRNMFESATSFNQPLNSWDVSSSGKIDSMFYNASSFNQPLNNWTTSNIEDMTFTFEYANSFNQDLSSWDISGVQSDMFSKGMTGMFNGSSLSTNTYSSILINWSQVSSLSNNITLGAGSIQYNNSANASRDSLITTYDWTINDGGCSNC